ncbi:hypothetical protein FACS189432_09700 [Bacteroidia bacterium]|nr:hypothetical protein FACS189426_06950 [Bacteroidia bacterium]GHT30670.1 hypothetical protein FACS189432_09700 [Bacteroidia bacterium]
MGLGSYIGDNCCIQGEIGRFTSIASNVSSRFAIHPYLEPYATTSPFFYSLKQPNTFAKKQIFIEHRYVDEKSKTPIVIGNDCWICERAFIQGGIRISDGVVVLAGAVVTKDIPPYSIVGGVPAKILKYRYDEDTINFLLKIKWWNNSIEWYKKNWELLCDIDKLKKHFNI